MHSPRACAHGNRQTPFGLKSKRNDILDKPAKKAPTGTDADLNLSTLSALFVDESKAREFLESKRWPDGDVHCPHCGECGAYKLTAKPGSKSPVRDGVWKCKGKGCCKQFAVRIGTIFEESKIPLCKWPVERVDAKTLHGLVRNHVDSKATVITDDLSSYLGVGQHFAGGHHSVNHSAKQYVRFNDDGMPVSTNTADSYSALLKRAHYGIHHQMSKKHLHRYCNERSFMWDNRKVSDGERMVAAIEGAEGKRLMYREPTT